MEQTKLLLPIRTTRLYIYLIPHNVGHGIYHYVSKLFPKIQINGTETRTSAKELPIPSVSNARMRNVAIPSRSSFREWWKFLDTEYLIDKDFTSQNLTCWKILSMHNSCLSTTKGGHWCEYCTNQSVFVCAIILSLNIEYVMMVPSPRQPEKAQQRCEITPLHYSDILNKNPHCNAHRLVHYGCCTQKTTQRKTTPEMPKFKRLWLISWDLFLLTQTPFSLAQYLITSPQDQSDLTNWNKAHEALQLLWNSYGNNVRATFWLGCTLPEILPVDWIRTNVKLSLSRVIAISDQMYKKSKCTKCMRELQLRKPTRMLLHLTVITSNCQKPRTLAKIERYWKLIGN